MNMITPEEASSYYPHSPYDFHIYGSAMDELLCSPPTTTTSTIGTIPIIPTITSPLLYNLSTIKHKIEQVETILTLQSSSPVPLVDASTLIEDIVVAASSMIFALQQLNNETHNTHPQHQQQEVIVEAKVETPEEILDTCEGSPTCEVIEINAADLLAKYTHYCHVCGKGFKRDANLRMHMRAHGDEYKSNAALVNPTKRGGDATEAGVATTSARLKYSCPQEGCRWNKRHAKFQPLKSMICVKNHYKRSHCPKLYVCKRCNRKQFSVLSDLRTHEKHCGDLKWRCSCGTTFSRKDKLMGHVALFAGHVPMAASGDLY